MASHVRRLKLYPEPQTGGRRTRERASLKGAAPSRRLDQRKQERNLPGSLGSPSGSLSGSLLPQLCQFSPRGSHLPALQRAVGEEAWGKPELPRGKRPDQKRRSQAEGGRRRIGKGCAWSYLLRTTSSGRRRPAAVRSLRQKCLRGHLIFSGGTGGHIFPQKLKSGTSEVLLLHLKRTLNKGREQRRGRKRELCRRSESLDGLDLTLSCQSSSHRQVFTEPEMSVAALGLKLTPIFLCLCAFHGNTHQHSMEASSATVKKNK
ncbi:uncharacterized protein LOC132355897 [Balaenoptera ricei]|uniref:uncharacterized protein LOC132355897 n=1 Tax=Balaenoptera ricei TaxID=2746895 RepID=UPI0028BE7972|nr:uncharacterized protein LOC132355897 [Balaenoptera ricei]